MTPGWKTTSNTYKYSSHTKYCTSLRMTQRAIITPSVSTGISQAEDDCEEVLIIELGQFLKLSEWMRIQFPSLKDYKKINRSGTLSRFQKHLLSFQGCFSTCCLRNRLFSKKVYTLWQKSTNIFQPVTADGSSKDRGHLFVTHQTLKKIMRIWDRALKRFGAS